MPERVVVVNTSPIQYLYQVGLLEAFPSLYGGIIIPDAVRIELAEGRARGVALPDPEAISWITVRISQNRALLPLVADLGSGEREVLQATKDFDTNRVISTAISARHAFVHRYRDEPAKGLAARERYAWLPGPKNDPLAEAVRVLNEKSVDLYIEQQAAHLTALIEPIRALRRRLFEASVREVLVVAGRRLPRSRFEALKALFDPFTDLV